MKKFFENLNYALSSMSSMSLFFATIFLSIIIFGTSIAFLLFVNVWISVALVTVLSLIRIIYAGVTGK